MAGNWAGATEHAMGGKGDTPPKEIHHIETKRSATHGDHTHVHHHTHPDHHPPETHTTRGDDEMAQHMMENMGTQNPGEAESDAGDAGSPVQAPNAPAGAASVAAMPSGGGAAPAPGGAPAPAGGM